MGKRKIESYEGKKTQKIQVGSYMLSGGKVHDFYDVPAKITKVAFIFKCNNCQRLWKKIRYIQTEKV